MNFKNIIVCLLGIMIIGFAGYYFYSIMFSKNVIRTVEYVHGKADTLFIPGVMKKTVLGKVFKGKIRVKKNDSTLFKDSTDSFGSNFVSMMIREINLDSVEVNFDFRYFNEMISRIDTLKIFRVDTVKITNIAEKNVPVYTSFWIGAGVGAAAVIMIIMMI